MARPLLPSHKETVNTATPGQWVDFSENFNAFQSSIDIPKHARINVTSIPSPWARMLLFKEAIMNVEHMLHKEVMSNILDVLEIIFFEEMFKFDLSTEEIHLSLDHPENKFMGILRKLYPQEGLGKGDVRVTLLMAQRGNQRFVLAGTSPYTLFFTPLNLQKNKVFKRYFKENPVLLRERPVEFQRWFLKEFLARLTQRGSYPELKAAFAFSRGICADSDTEDPNREAYYPSDLFARGNILDGLFDKIKPYQIHSANLIKPSKSAGKQPPLLIDASGNLKGLPYYNGYTFEEDMKTVDLAALDRDVLPLEELRYPWLLPQIDFLQPCIIRYRYKLNDEFLVLGKKSNEFRYLPPLSDKYFEFFTPEDVDRHLSVIEENNHSVKIKLQIPLLNGREMIIERRYKDSYGKTNLEDSILEFDSLDMNTPLPHLVIWPKLHPDNWNRPYYCLTYGNRFSDPETEVISMEYKDEDYHDIERKTSRKSEQIEITRLDKLPTYVIVKHNKSGTKGFLLIDHKVFPRYDLDDVPARVGIDFGTSHTNIAIRVNGQTEVLKYNSQFEGLNINTSDFISTVAFTDEQMKSKESIPILIKAGLNQYLYPNALGEANTADVVNLPLPTMIIKEQDCPNPEMLLHSSVNFSKQRYFPYSLPARGVQKTVREMTDLKWNQEIINQNASREYLNILLNLARCELIKKHVNPACVEFYWAYPRSFSEVDLDRYKVMWHNILEGARKVGHTDESKAALMYFDSTQDLAAQSPGIIIVVDIGGGSSDISVWRHGKILLLNSSLWAGKNMVGFKDGNGVHSVIYHTVVREFPEIAGQYQGLSDFQTHLNYVLYSLTDAQLAQYTQSDRFYKAYFLILYFFSSLIYEIGLQCKRFVTPDLESVDICLAGNGSRFAGWSGGGGSEICSSDSRIYSRILRETMGLGDQVNVRFIPSPKKKWEVAVGLCEGKEALLNQKASHEPLLAEDISLGAKVLLSDTLISELDKQHSKEAGILAVDKNRSELAKFHELLFGILGSSELYTRALRHDPALSNLDALKGELLGNWDTLVGQVRQKATDNLRDRSSITSSLFILGMQAVIHKLHKYFSARA